MKKAFTLIELIFVIVVIGVLSAVAIPKYQNLVINAEINKIIQLIQTITSNYQAAWTYQVSLEGKNPKDIRTEDMFSTSGGLWVKANNNTQFGKDWQFYTKKSLAKSYIINLRPRKGYLEFWVVCSHYKSKTYENLCIEKFKELGYTKITKGNTVKGHIMLY